MYDRTEGSTYLLNKLGRLCCLGFESLRQGATRAQILKIAIPSDLQLNLGWMTTLVSAPWAPMQYLDSPLAEQAMNINDNANIDDAERERQLIEVFAEAGVELSFEG